MRRSDTTLDTHGRWKNRVILYDRLAWAMQVGQFVCWLMPTRPWAKSDTPPHGLGTNTANLAVPMEQGSGVWVVRAAIAAMRAGTMRFRSLPPMPWRSFIQASPAVSGFGVLA